MAKPICVIYFPDNFYDERDRSWIYDYMWFLNGEKSKGRKTPSQYFTQYYWFCFHKEGITEPEFKVFHEKDFTEIQFEELKKMVLDAIKK